jgi:hypothetical protein
MAEQPARTFTNGNMDTVTQRPQEQIVPYGYGSNNGYQYAYPYDGYQDGHGSNNGYPQQYPSGYPHAPHYPYAPPPPQVPSVNVVLNINPNGHNNNYDGHPAADQFQPAPPQTQRHSYHQPLQLQQAQPPRFEIMQGQRSQSGSGTGKPPRFDNARANEIMQGQRSRSGSGTGKPQRFEIMQGQRSQSGSGTVVFQDEYNLPGFITRYANAKFFVIKSYSKEHVLSSIRHGVWTSTLRGNRKLNAAYSEAATVEQRVEGRTSGASSSNCPIFLLFSVSVSLDFISFQVIVNNSF